MRKFRNFCQDKSGATAIEYGLIVALIAGAIIAVFGTDNSSGLRGNLNTSFNSIGSTLTTNTSGN